MWPHSLVKRLLQSKNQHKGTCISMIVSSLPVSIAEDVVLVACQLSLQMHELIVQYHSAYFTCVQLHCYRSDVKVCPCFEGSIPATYSGISQIKIGTYVQGQTNHQAN